MNKPRFTKAPWVVGCEGIGVRDQSDTQSYGMLNVVCRVDKYDFKEHEYNAHLIASAPDMYAEIQDDIYYLKRELDNPLEADKFRLVRDRIAEKEDLLARARGDK